METLPLKIRRYREDLGLMILCVALFVAARASWGVLFPVALLLLALSPVPLSLVFLRNGNADGLLAAAGSMAMVVAIFPAGKAAAALGLFLPLMLCGALYGLMANARAGLVRTLVTGTASLAVLVMAVVYGTGVSELAMALAEDGSGGERSGGEHGEQTAATQAAQAARSAARARLAPLVNQLVPTKAGENSSQLAANREAFEAAFSFWFRFPLFFAAAAALMLFGGYVFLVQRVLARVGVLPPSPRFVEWSVPWEYSWCLIGAILALLVTLVAGSEWSQCVASNVALIVALPYAVMTFSITGALLERRQVGPFFTVFVHLVVLLHLPYLSLFAMLDPWVDYRRLSTGAADAAEGSQDEDEE